MNHDQLIERIETAWSDFYAAFDGLDETQIIGPGVCEQWTIKDLIGHLATWEEECIHHVPLILAGGRPPRYKDKYGGLDAFNALTVGARSTWDLATMKASAAETHTRLVEFVRTVPYEAIEHESRVRRRIRLDTYGHYPLHTRQILDWRRQNQ